MPMPDMVLDWDFPFTFALQGLVLALFASVLWSIFINEEIITKMRYLPRLIFFVLSLMALLTVSVLVFFVIPTAWAKLWLIVSGCVAVGVIMLSILSELYMKVTGKRYTEALNDYKKKII